MKKHASTKRNNTHQHNGRTFSSIQVTPYQWNCICTEPMLRGVSAIVGVGNCKYEAVERAHDSLERNINAENE